MEKNLQIYTQPLKKAENLLLNVLQGITPLVNIVFTYLPRYKCYLEHDECEHDHVFIQDSYFQDVDLLLVNLKGNKGNLVMATTKDNETVWSGCLTVQEEPNEELFYRWQEVDLESEHFYEEQEKQHWSHYFDRPPKNVDNSIVRHTISFDGEHNVDQRQSVIMFDTRHECVFSHNYRMFYLVECQLSIKLPESTLIPEPS